MWPAPSELNSLCSTGQLQELQTFFNHIIHSLSSDEQAKYCTHAKGNDHCNDVPCTFTLTNVANIAAGAGQTAIFTYLWDCFLAPRGIKRIPWLALHAAARHGSIPLAEAFYARDSEYFKSFVDEDAAAATVHGRTSGGTQLNTAIRNDRLDYAGYILDRGADVNYGFPGNSPVRASVKTEADDEITLRGVQFLVGRGARVKGSGVRQAAASLGRLNVTEYLLSGGIDVDDLEANDPSKANMRRPSPLISAAACGRLNIVQFLLRHGADARYVDPSGLSALLAAEENHRDNVVEILRNYQPSAK